VIDLHQPSSEDLGDLGDISRIEMNVRVAGRVDIAERAVDDFRDLEFDYVLRCLEKPWRAGAGCGRCRTA